MMTVWIVTVGNSDDTIIHGVYATEMLARLVTDKLQATDTRKVPDSYWYEPYEVLTDG